jgi:preprotein translocase subunit Sec61beta
MTKATAFAPIARIILRYVVGGSAGAAGVAAFVDPALLERIAVDPDMILLVSAILAGLTELIYVWAKKSGGAT